MPGFRSFSGRETIGVTSAGCRRTRTSTWAFTFPYSETSRSPTDRQDGTAVGVFALSHWWARLCFVCRNRTFLLRTVVTSLHPCRGRSCIAGGLGTSSLENVARLLDPRIRYPNTLEQPRHRGALPSMGAFCESYFVFPISSERTHAPNTCLRDNLQRCLSRGSRGTTLVAATLPQHQFETLSCGCFFACVHPTASPSCDTRGHHLRYGRCACCARGILSWSSTAGM